MITAHWKPDAGELAQRLSHVMAELGVSREVASRILTDEATYAEHFNAGQKGVKAAFHRIMRPVNTGERRKKKKPGASTQAQIRKRLMAWARRQPGEFTLKQVRVFMGMNEESGRRYLNRLVADGFLTRRAGGSGEKGRYYFKAVGK